MKRNGLDIPPPGAWALLDIVIKRTVQQWRETVEEFNVSWYEAAKGLPTPIALKTTIVDPLIGGRVELAIQLEFSELNSVRAEYFPDTGVIGLFPGAKQFRHLRDPSDEHLRSDLFTAMHHAFAHEYQHKRQDLIGELPALDAWPRHLQSKLFYLDRPWETDAFAADIAYRLVSTQLGTTRFSEARVRSHVRRELAKVPGTEGARDRVAARVIELLRDTGWLA